MHMTLRFIGEVDGGAFAEIRDALAQIRAEAFTLALEGVGHFPPRGRARILWAGVVPNPALIHLHERTEAAVTGLGFEPDGRNYAPHVTLARFASKVPAQRLQDFIAYHGLYTSGPFPVRSFELFSSHLGRAGRSMPSRRAIPSRPRRRAAARPGAAPQPAASMRSMSSSDRPKWWPISWISTWRTTASRLSPVSIQ